MELMALVRFAIVPLLLAGASLASAQADPATIARIVDQGKNHNQVMNHLRYLTKKIGPRLTTSENLDKAYEWTQKKFREFGCKNVHLEQWGEWPVGFQRMKSSGTMVSPERRVFEFTTPSWTEGTHGKKRGLAVYAPSTMDELNAQRDSFKGKWVVYKEPPFRRPRGRRGEQPPAITPEQQAKLDLQEAISKLDCLGVVAPSTNELTITSGNYRDKTFENHPMDVSVIIRKSDMAAVSAAMDAGKPVQLEFNLNQKFLPGPRKNYDVVAEIPGTEKPDEVVIVGGHLDSWDGPGSEGAADNGTGTSCTLEVARILNKAGVKPKRTIRFILFTGEEQGLFGSAGYVEAHKDDLPKISAVFIEDSGANYESGTYALASQVSFLQPILDVNNQAFPAMPMTLRTVETMPRGGGSDHASFNRVGVPAFFWDKKGDTDYTFIHHTQYDTYERVPKPYMVQASTNEAVAAYITACQPDMMPRAPVEATADTPGK